MQRKRAPRSRIPGNPPDDHPRALHLLQDEIAACTICPSLEPWRQFSRSAYGRPGTGYLMVGEAPGYVSWKNERRFTGPAGLLIRRALRRVDHPTYCDLEDLFYLTDVVKCHPTPTENSRANRSPSRAELSACSGYLMREFEVIHPSVIVTFGKLATESVQWVADHTAVSQPTLELISFPHPSPRNQRTILRRFPSMEAFEQAISVVFERLIARLEQRISYA
ncbi:MAG: uracil-DNA glycosylase family protein [Nitrospiraceae bacterium]